MRGLLIEDDILTAKGIMLTVKSAGVIMDVADTGEEALDLANHYDYDFIILDLMLPDISGFEVIRRMRAACINVPVLVLSGLSGPQAKVRALTAGADDYMTKPFDKAELVARFQTIVRRSRGFVVPTLRVGELELNQHNRDLFIAGTKVVLTGKEYGILELLMLRKGMAMTKDAFLNHLYGGIDEPDSKIIDVFICKLRKKIAEAGGGQVIHTVWGHGYTLREPAATAAEASRPLHPTGQPLREELRAAA